MKTSYKILSPENVPHSIYNHRSVVPHKYTISYHYFYMKTLSAPIILQQLQPGYQSQFQLRLFKCRHVYDLDQNSLETMII